ncbi:MAG: electron transfer flavoprotein subunit alpha [Ignavibacteriales bacterium CG_4_9_14_3_um_filter_30_11]|nr:MAG: electron transfer flavoprotein subunit alpha [Ignavibacteriales bacterium CG_4_9_14_3_um_filter_30_11]
MANTILAILEQREGKLKKSSFETASVAAKIAKNLNLTVVVVAIGNDISNLEEVSNYGVSNVTHFKNNVLSNYSSSAYTKIITEYAKEISADYLITANTSFGKDLAPRVGIKLNAGCLVDCVKLDVQNNEVIATRPIYAGKALMETKLNSNIKLFTIRPNVFKPEENKVEYNLTTKNVDNPDTSTIVSEFKKAEGKLDVAEADIIVSGGRGLKSAEEFKLIEELADALGAAVGASRAVVDAGWRPHREQVGQTGKTVSPSLYVACGISGAIQHLAGMSSSKYIVAINKDKDAPIFGVADYGINGDVFEILPKLTEAIKLLD